MFQKYLRFFEREKPDRRSDFFRRSIFHALFSLFGVEKPLVSSFIDSFNYIIHIKSSTPYPTFMDNTAGVIYRGGGLFAVKNNDERKNQAAYIFAKWLTEKEHNLDFVTNAGYHRL